MGRGGIPLHGGAGAGIDVGNAFRDEAELEGAAHGDELALAVLAGVKLRFVAAVRSADDNAGGTSGAALDADGEGFAVLLLEGADAAGGEVHLAGSGSVDDSKDRG